MVEELEPVQGKERFSYHLSKRKSALCASLSRLIPTCLKTDKVEVVFQLGFGVDPVLSPSLFMHKSSRRNGALYVGILNYNGSQIVSFDRKLVTCDRKLE